MAKKIKWTKTASRNFDDIINYLAENWPADVVAGFIRTTNETLFLLSRNPDLGEVQEEKRMIRGLLVTKHNKLFYRVERQRIVVLKIFDTRQNPKKLKFRK